MRLKNAFRKMSNLQGRPMTASSSWRRKLKNQNLLQP